MRCFVQKCLKVDIENNRIVPSIEKEHHQYTNLTFETKRFRCIHIFEFQISKILAVQLWRVPPPPALLLQAAHAGTGGFWLLLFTTLTLYVVIGNTENCVSSLVRHVLLVHQTKVVVRSICPFREEKQKHPLTETGEFRLTLGASCVSSRDDPAMWTPVPL